MEVFKMILKKQSILWWFAWKFSLKWKKVFDFRKNKTVLGVLENFRLNRILHHSEDLSKYSWLTVLGRGFSKGVGPRPTSRSAGALAT